MAVYECVLEFWMKMWISISAQAPDWFVHRDRVNSTSRSWRLKALYIAIAKNWLLVHRDHDFTHTIANGTSLVDRDREPLTTRSRRAFHCKLHFSIFALFLPQFHLVSSLISKINLFISFTRKHEENHIISTYSHINKSKLIIKECQMSGNLPLIITPNLETLLVLKQNKFKL